MMKRKPGRKVTAICLRPCEAVDRYLSEQHKARPHLSMNAILNDLLMERVSAEAGKR